MYLYQSAVKILSCLGTDVRRPCCVNVNNKKKPDRYIVMRHLRKNNI